MPEDIYDIFEMSTNLFSTGASGEAIVEEGAKVVNVVGRSRVGGRRRALYGDIDVIGALAKPISYSATTDFAMSVDQASAVTGFILNACGLTNESDSIKFYFVQAMQLCFAMNSSSVLMPGRATFKLHLGDESGVPSEFNLFADVVKVVGNDVRRYFRAYADETRTVLNNLRREYMAGPRSESSEDLNTYDVVSDQWGAILRVANSRGLSRVPDLVHDSAENCSNLTSTELAFLASAKVSIFGNGSYRNEVDNPVVGRAPASGGRVGAVPASSAQAADLGPNF